MRLPTAQDFDGRSVCLSLLLLVLLLVSALHLRWLQSFRVFELPPRWDEAMFHLRAMQFSDAIREGGGTALWQQVRASGEPRPPLLPLSTLALYPLGTYEIWFGHATILLYLCLLVVAVYFIGEHLLGPAAGLSSAICVMFFPYTVAYSRVMLSDLPTAALAAMAILCLLRSEFYARIPWNIGIGVSVGLAMNMRNFAGAYLVVPLLYGFVRGIRVQGAKVVPRILPGIVAGVALLLPWYGLHWKDVLEFFSAHTYGDLAKVHLTGDPSDFFMPSGGQPPPIFYTRALLFSGPSILFGIPILVLAFAAWRRPHGNAFPSRPQALIIALWAVGSVAILSTISNISHNYSMPFLPPVALMLEYLAAAAGLVRGLRVYLVIPILAITGTHFVQPLGLEIGDTIRGVYYKGVPATTPINPDWKIRDVLQEIARRSVGKPVQVATIGSHPFFSSNAFRLDIYRQRLPIGVTETLLNRDAEILDCLAKSDFVVTKSGAQYPIAAVISPQRLMSFFDGTYLRYEHVPVRLGLPDGSDVQIFRHLGYSSTRSLPEVGTPQRAQHFSERGSMIEGSILNPVSVELDNTIEFRGGYQHRRLGLAFARLFWHVLRRPTTHLRSFVHILDKDGRTIVQADHDPAGGGSTLTWLPGQLTAEGTLLRERGVSSEAETWGIGMDQSPGDTRLEIFSSTLPLDNENSRALLPVQLTNAMPPKEVFEPLEGTEYVAQPVEFGDSAVLASCRLVRTAKGPCMQYVWRCIGPFASDFKIFVHFTDAVGEIMFQDDHEPMEGQVPTSRWRPGDWIVETRLIRIDPLSVAAPIDCRLGFESPDTLGKYLTVMSAGVESDWDGLRAILRDRRGPVVSQKEH